MDTEPEWPAEIAHEDMLTRISEWRLMGYDVDGRGPGTDGLLKKVEDLKGLVEIFVFEFAGEWDIAAQYSRKKHR